ncbi:glutathione S-transferase omega-1 [Rhypophila decipiens]|uniref:Glutathione S-transferase omega-1 n=1 Tax=Rhypophila decipiens TaxID=261697 RepID=A0AAN6Y5Z8_9PEZI|nr:glutathione S-transferase omega-1 [Rhypophila decipiens]
MDQPSGELHEDERISQPQAQPPAQSHSGPYNSSLSMQFQHDESGSLQQHAHHQHNMGSVQGGQGGSNLFQERPAQVQDPISSSGQESDISEQEEFQPGSSGSASGPPPTKFVEDPPDLDNWRRKLFDLEEAVVLTQQQYQTYFPWVDNVYSHRSTYTVQDRPCTYHSWNCRLKGLNTPYAKSGVPQCSVRILISEYPTGAVLWSDPRVQAWAYNPSRTNRIDEIKSELAPCYLIGLTTQPHQHTLEVSDVIGKNSVLRWIEAREQVVEEDTEPSRWKATGVAANTVERHAVEHEMKLYAASFSPFSQRVWIALEAKGLPYQYCETDPSRQPKPTQLLGAIPRGLTLAIRHGDWSCGGSFVILEYLEDISQDVSLLPFRARRKAHCRLWIAFINATVVPSFYAVLEAVGDTLPEANQKLQADLSLLVQAADEEGPYFMGQEMCLVDIHLAPFVLWFQRLPDRFALEGWTTTTNKTDKEYGRSGEWLRALTTNRHVRNTTSGEELYHDALDVVIQEYRGRLG